MTDETRSEEQATEGATAVANPAEEPAAAASPPEEPAPKKLRQDVDIEEVGPCKKHIKVSVNRDDINERMGEHFSKLVHESNVTGFRPGKAPRRLIEKRFHKEVSDQVKNEVLMASLEQLGTDNDIAPLTAPDIDPAKIEIPLNGPMVYEFAVEVRPSFELPPYRGLRLKRPVKTFTDEDVALARRNLLASRGQIVPKENGVAELGDILIAEITIRDGARVTSVVKEAAVQVEKQLAFKDALIKDFADKIKGVKAGDKRTFDVELSSSAASGMAGKVLQADFDVKDVKTIRLPELTPDFLQENFNVATPGRLDEAIRVALERQLVHQQRRSARAQVISQIAEASKWELPPELLMRQAQARSTGV